MNKEELLSVVLEQVSTDIREGHIGALRYMLRELSETTLIEYLSEDIKPIDPTQAFLEYLDNNELDYKVHNNAAHVVVIGKDYRTYDVYPSTGKWKSREEAEYNKGLQNFYRELEGK